MVVEVLPGHQLQVLDRTDSQQQAVVGMEEMQPCQALGDRSELQFCSRQDLGVSLEQQYWEELLDSQLVPSLVLEQADLVFVQHLGDRLHQEDEQGPLVVVEVLPGHQLQALDRTDSQQQAVVGLAEVLLSNLFPPLPPSFHPPP